MFKLTASRKTPQPPNWQQRQWHSSASTEELWPLQPEIYEEITKESTGVRTRHNKGKRVLIPQTCFEECTVTERGHASVLLCVLGLALFILQQRTCCPQPLQCWDHLAVQEARFTNTASQSSNKMVGNTQGVQHTPFLSSATAYSCCTISMNHVDSNCYLIPVKTMFWTIFSVRY